MASEGSTSSDELQRRVHAPGSEQAPRQRVVEGLVQLGVDQALQQRAVAGVHPQPQRALADRLTGKAAQRIHLLGDAQVVQGDALDRILSRTGPVALLEALPRPRGDRRKAGVVLLETVADGYRDARCQLGSDVRPGHAWLTREDRLHHTLACAMPSSAKVVPAAGRQHRTVDGSMQMPASSRHYWLRSPVRLPRPAPCAAPMPGWTWYGPARCRRTGPSSSPPGA